jgi:integration host factor subunit beta
MNRSDLVERLWANFQLPRRDVDLAVNTIVKHMLETLAAGKRTELRGFGSFSLRYRAAQVRHNPKTGQLVTRYRTNTCPIFGLARCCESESTVVTARRRDS